MNQAEFGEKNLGVSWIPLEHLRLNPDNERQTWRLDNLTDLVDSIKRTNGNVTPGIVELEDYQRHDLTKSLDEIIAHEDPTFTIYGGNRRFMSLQMLDIPTMSANVLYNLTDEERLEIQFAENATKTKIPTYQIADSIWELYLFKNSMELGATELSDTLYFEDFCDSEH